MCSTSARFAALARGFPSDVRPTPHNWALHIISSYIGTYRDPWYGDVFVQERNGGLMMRCGRSELLTGPLEHFQYDTFVARWLDRSLHGDAYATFVIGADGTVEAIRMKMFSPDTDFSFDFHHLDLRRVPVEE